MESILGSCALPAPKKLTTRGRNGAVSASASSSICFSTASAPFGGGRVYSSGGSHFGKLVARRNKTQKRKPCVPQSVVAVSAKMGGAVEVLVQNEPLMELSEGQTQFFHRLPAGLRMEVICQKASANGDSSRVPLVFVHGSYHGAWCWACFWMPYFAARGHDCYAISLLGQGASDMPSGKVSFSLQSHAGDLAHFIKHNLNAPPVLIGHSFGGLIVQWFFPPSTKGREEPFPSIAAAALLCSTPPTGNGPMVKRFIKRDLFSSLQIVLSLAAKMFGTSLSICRKSFFSPDMPEAEVRKYQQVLKRSSRCPMIDLQKLNDSLPLPKLQSPALPVCVLAAENDFIVDLEGSQETAEWYGTEPVVITGSGHDIMLDSAWEKAAEALQSWLNGQAL
ncbi:unnamed protein product [Calypogeia fissa]